jgi:hypothetical protein
MVHPQQRVRVEGFADSDVHVKIAVVQLKTGSVHLVVEGVESTIQNLIDVRQLLDQMVKEIDAKLPSLVNESVKEMQRG